MDDAQPQVGQLLGAGFVAAAAAVTPVAVFMAIADFRQPELVAIAFLFGMPVALLHAYLIGLPFYAVLREKWALTWPRALLGGFVVGAAPAGVVALMTLGPHSDVFWVAATPGALGTVGAAAFRAMLGPSL
jgi:hypothetical protein